MIRFWDFDVTSSSARQPVFSLYGDHDKLDALTSITTTEEDNDYFVTGDTAGCMKMWDFTNFNFRVDYTSENIVERWFIQTHKRVINCIQIVSVNREDGAELFIVSSSNDHNIHLTRFTDGVHIGQFGQDSMWNINDLSAFSNRQPKYTRSWLAKVFFIYINDISLRKSAALIGRRRPSVSGPTQRAALRRKAP